MDAGLTQAVVTVRDHTGKDPAAALAAILASPHRMPGRKDRDAARHPLETLMFFGLKPTQTVVEIDPGAGWYTEILAPLLANHGKLIVAGAGREGARGKNVDGRRASSRPDAREVSRAVRQGRAGQHPQRGRDQARPDGSADLVLVMRMIHDWQRDGELDKYLAAIHAVLKPGGTLGVEAHRAAAGTKGEDTAKSGYLAEQWLIDRVTAAGFELAGKSEINANPKDTKDYPKGVWTLPPGFARATRTRRSTPRSARAIG